MASQRSGIECEGIIMMIIEQSREHRFVCRAGCFCHPRNANQCRCDEAVAIAFGGQALNLLQTIAFAELIQDFSGERRHDIALVGFAQGLAKRCEHGALG